MELTFSKYWLEILEHFESEGGCIEDVSSERLEFIKNKAKSLYKKDVDVYDAFERVVELF